MLQLVNYISRRRPPAPTRLTGLSRLVNTVFFVNSYIFFAENNEKYYVKAGEEVRLDDMINVKLYKVFNLFAVRLFQYIETSNIE